MTCAQEGHSGTGKVRHRVLAGLSVLVADHYEPLRWFKVHLLRRMGAEVVEAASGSEVLAALKKRRVDVALLDCGLVDPPLTEVRKRMRQSPITAAIPVIYVSESGSDPSPGEAEGFLLGPVDADELAITILLVLGVSAFSRGPQEPPAGEVN